MHLSRSQHLLLAAGVFLLLILTLGMLWVLALPVDWYVCGAIGFGVGVTAAIYWIGLPNHVVPDCVEEEYEEEYEPDESEQRAITLARLPMLEEWHGAVFVVCRTLAGKEYLSVLSREVIQYSSDGSLALRFTDLEKSLRALAYCHKICGKEYEFSTELWMLEPAPRQTW